MKARRSELGKAHSNGWIVFKIITISLVFIAAILFALIGALLLQGGFMYAGSAFLLFMVSSLILAVSLACIPLK